MRGFATTENRDSKAKKIAAVLCDALEMDEISGLTILDIGSGSGHIAGYFAKTNKVIASDIENQLCVDEPQLKFVKLTGVNIPFEDSTFDIVILNHALYLVADQKHELEEVRRVLKPTGVCYLADPNRAFPFEPFAKIPFINYLPMRAYERIMRFLTGADERIKLNYFWDMQNVIKSAGLEFRDYTTEILNNPQLFRSDVSVRLPAWRWLSWLSPTNIYILRTRKV